MKKLLLILFLVLFSFGANASDHKSGKFSHEIVNLKLLCSGKNETLKNNQLITKEDDYKKIIEIKNNVYKDKKTSFTLKVNPGFIGLEILNDKNRVIYKFLLDRTTGELFIFKRPRYTYTEYTVKFSGSCRTSSKSF